MPKYRLIPEYWKRISTDSEALVTDVYYSDLNDWSGNLVGGVYVTYLDDGTGILSPKNPYNPHPKQDMIHGRIDAKQITTSLTEQAEKVRDYLKKINDYREFGSPLTPEEYNSGFRWHDDDYVASEWRLNPNPYNEWKKPVTGQCAIAGDIQYLHDYTVTSKSFLIDSLEQGALTGIIACHSGPDHLAIRSWDQLPKVNVDGSFNNDFLDTISPKVHMLYLFCCSTANFSKRNLAAQFLFDNPYTYTVFAKTNPSNEYFRGEKKFYTNINTGLTVGETFLNEIDEVHNYYNQPGKNLFETGEVLGHIVLGDPLITYNNTNNSFDDPNDPNDTNRFPFITTDLKRLEAAVGKEFSLTFDIDPDSLPHTVTLEQLNEQQLPANMVFNETTKTISFIPTIDQVETTYYLKVTVMADNTPENKHSEIFSIYVTYVENQLLINGQSGWSTSGTGTITDNFSRAADERSLSGFTRMIPECETAGYLRLTQENIRVNPNRIYKVFFYISNALTSGNEHVSFEIPELNVNRPLVNGKNSREEEEFCFVVNDQEFITIHLNIGDSAHSVTGDIAFEMMKIMDVAPFVPGDIYVSDYIFIEVENGWGPVEIDTSNGQAQAGDGNTITLSPDKDGNDTPVEYPKGLGVHANSTVLVPLFGYYRRFQSYIGVDDEITAVDPPAYGTVIFEVYLDNVSVFQSGVMGPNSRTEFIDIDVAGAHELKLCVTDAGDTNNSDHADWAGAILLSGSQSEKTYQAEVASIYRSCIENEHAGYTGDGYVNIYNESGSYVEWTIETSEEIADALFDFKFANGEATREMDIIVNGNTVISNFEFPSTGAWNNWNQVTTTLSLSEGTNKVKLLSTTGSGGPNFDELTITCATGSLSEGGTDIYQAEYGTWDDADVDSAHSGYFGTGYVNTANTTNTWVEWTVDMPYAVSNAQVGIRYANGKSEDRIMDIYVNGSIQISDVSFPQLGAEWDIWDTQTVYLNLDAGINTIRTVASTSSGAPNLDQLEITY